MADPVIVPATPTVNQGETIEPNPQTADKSPGLEQVQAVFDRIYPDQAAKGKESPQETDKIPEPFEPPVPPEPPKEQKMPSFLEEALKVERPPGAVKPESPKAPPEEEFPEEPVFKTSEEAKTNWKKMRDAYKKAKVESETLRSRPAHDEGAQARLAQLESQNQEMGQILTRMGVETHQEFQNQIIRPMSAAWEEAARTVGQAGGDPKALSQALMLTGKEQFEALDEILENIPESAKLEAHQHISRWRRLNDQRINALRNAPKTIEALRQKDMAEQYKVFTQQREEQKALFEEALTKLRDEAKVEILMPTKEEGAQWWNEQAEGIIENARQLYMENTDMGKMAMASILAPMADAYRKLWLAERAAHEKTRGTLDSRYESEPSLSESAGSSRTPEGKLQSDLSRPFSDVFLEEFHRQRNRNR